MRGKDRGSDRPRRENIQDTATAAAVPNRVIIAPPLIDVEDDTSDCGSEEAGDGHAKGDVWTNKQNAHLEEDNPKERRISCASDRRRPRIRH